MNQPNSLTLVTKGLDDDIMALTPGEACYIRARVTLESADRTCRHFTIDEVAHDGEASAAPDTSEAEPGEYEDEEDEDEMEDAPTGEAPKGDYVDKPKGMVIMMKGPR